MSRKDIQPIENKKERELSIERFLFAVDFEIVRNVTRGVYSGSSELAIASDWNRFVVFCSANKVRPLPASFAAVRLFLEKESHKRKFSSIKRYSVSIGVIHKVHGFKDPRTNRQLKLVLKQLETQKQGDARQANAFTDKHLIKLDKIISKDSSSISCRDLCIYYLMFECALKRSELRNLHIEDINEDAGLYTISIGENRYRLSERASAILRKWLAFLPTDGYCFRRIDKHGNLGDTQLDDSSIYRVMRRASDKLGLSEDMRFTSQSPRVGVVRELKLQGHDLKDIQTFGRWLSPAMPAQYLNFLQTSNTEKSKFKIIRPWD